MPWEIEVIADIAEAGVDVRKADVIVDTSAGILAFGACWLRILDKRTETTDLEPIRIGPGLRGTVYWKC